MKAGKVVIIIFTLASIALSFAFKQYLPVARSVKTMDSCLKEVKDIYEQMYNLLPQEGKTYLFNYSISSTLNSKDKDGKNIISHSDIELYTSKTQYRFISKSISVYQDAENKFTILPTQKTIYWADSNMGLVKENQMERMKRIQDTIFRYAQVIDCKKMEKEVIDKIVKVKLEKKFSDYMQINQVTYYLDSKHKVLKRIYIEYPSTKDVLALDFTFKEADYNYTKTQLEAVKSIFIEDKATLKDLYKNYKLIDVRKKK